MPAEMRKTRRLAGIDSATGAPQFSVTFDSGEDEPASVGDWVGRRRESLATLMWMPAARAAFAMLDGGDAKAIGKNLDGAQRYAVGRLLADWKQLAESGYGPAVALVTQVAGEWTRCWGDEAPKPGRDEPAWTATPVTLDRPLAQVPFGCAPVQAGMKAGPVVRAPR